jgi:hypothetical protein
MFQDLLLVIVVAALCGNLLVSFQMRDRLEGILNELKKGKG